MKETNMLELAEHRDLLTDPEASFKKEKCLLPCGYIDEEGRVHETATLMELGRPGEIILGLGSRGEDLDSPVDQLIFAHLVSIGPYTDDDNRRRFIDTMLKGDKDAILIKLVRMSFGEKYEFYATCVSCKTEDMHTIQLSELPIKIMPEREKRHYEFTSRTGAKHVFRHLVSKDDQAYNEVRDANIDLLGRILALHLVSVDGVSPDQRLRDLVDSPPRMQIVLEGVKMLDKTMPHFNDREHVRAMLRRSMGGVDQVMRMRCRHCGTNFRGRVPINPTLLLPHLGQMGEAAEAAGAFDF